MSHTLSRNAIVGYSAGIITGITYGLNPLFGVPLMENGVQVASILFFRYFFAVVLLGVYLLLKGASFRVTWRQVGILCVLGLLYTSSSLMLFEAYKHIASGLATTLVFLYPVIVAIIMVFLKVMPTWQVWLSIAVTFAGVLIMTHSDSAQSLDPVGIILSVGSAASYSLFIVIINRSRSIHAISNSLLTFYALSIGAIVFAVKALYSGVDITVGIDSAGAWLNLLGLALLPTVVSTATLAVATRKIGATKASVLGVFEPVTAILVGTVVFGEILSANIITGIVLAVSAVVFMIVAAKKTPQTETVP